MCTRPMRPSSRTEAPSSARPSLLPAPSRSPPGVAAPPPRRGRARLPMELPGPDCRAHLGPRGGAAFHLEPKLGDSPLLLLLTGSGEEGTKENRARGATEPDRPTQGSSLPFPRLVPEGRACGSLLGALGPGRPLPFSLFWVSVRGLPCCLLSCQAALVCVEGSLGGLWGALLSGLGLPGPTPQPSLLHPPRLGPCGCASWATAS